MYHCFMLENEIIGYKREIFFISVRDDISLIMKNNSEGSSVKIMF